nr:hypothetical protein [Mesorhizobium sp.]
MPILYLKARTGRNDARAQDDATFHGIAKRQNVVQEIPAAPDGRQAVAQGILACAQEIVREVSAPKNFLASAHENRLREIGNTHLRTEMNMGVDKPGYDCAPVQIDYRAIGRYRKAGTDSGNHTVRD